MGTLYQLESLVYKRDQFRGLFGVDAHGMFVSIFIVSDCVADCFEAYRIIEGIDQEYI